MILRLTELELFGHCFLEHQGSRDELTSDHALLAVAWLLASTPQGFAQDDAPSTQDALVAGATHSSTRRPSKTRSKHTATHHPAAKSLPADAEQIDPAAERAASLERRRKAFFANKPDDRQPDGDGSSAPVGVTLGGSGGLTPEMGLKF